MAMMTYAAAKATKALLEAESNRTGAVMRNFPRGPMGLTPDAVKCTPEWRAAYNADVVAFARLRKFNRVFVRVFAGEAKAERAARRQALMARSS